MENPLCGTSPDLLECVRNIPCTLSVRRLQEITRENLEFLLQRYPEVDFPLLNQELKESAALTDQLGTIECPLGQMFWMLHVYLCFYSNHANPLMPKDAGRRKILGYFKELKSVA